MLRVKLLLPVIAVLAASAAGGARAEEPVAEVRERDPYLGAPLPENVIYETKNGWKFKDDQLVFANENPNKDGKRYLVWKEYHWVISENEITVLDPRPFGTVLTASRHGSDKKGKPLKDEKVMDALKDEAGDLRRAREPEPPPAPVHIGIGFGWGFWGGGRHHHRHRH